MFDQVPPLPGFGSPAPVDNPLRGLLNGPLPTTPGSGHAPNAQAATDAMMSRVRAIQALAQKPQVPQIGGQVMQALQGYIPPPQPMNYAPLPASATLPVSYPPEETTLDARSSLESATRNAVPLSDFATMQAKNNAAIAGAQAMQNVYSGLAPADGTPYTAPALPERVNAPIPIRQAPAAPPLAVSGLAALAGLIAPQHAGDFAEAPLAAAQRLSEQQFKDALNNYELQQQQNNLSFGDLLNGRNDTVANDLRNRGFADTARKENNTQSVEAGTVGAQLAGAQKLGGALPSLLAADNARLAAGAEEKIGLNTQDQLNGLDKTATDNDRINKRNIIDQFVNGQKNNQFAAEFISGARQADANRGQRAGEHADDFALQSAAQAQKQAQQGFDNTMDQGKFGLSLAASQVKAAGKDGKDAPTDFIGAVEKHPIVANANKALALAQKAYNDAANTPQGKDNNTPDRATDQIVARNREAVRAAELAQEQAKADAYNQLAGKYSVSPLPTDPHTGRPYFPGGVTDPARRNNLPPTHPPTPTIERVPNSRPAYHAGDYYDFMGSSR